MKGTPPGLSDPGGRLPEFNFIAVAHTIGQATRVSINLEIFIVLVYTNVCFKNSLCLKNSF